MHGNLIYHDANGAQKALPLEHAIIVINNEAENDHSVAIRFFNPEVGKRQKIKFQAPNRAERDKFVDSLQTHIDFLSSHLTGNDMRFEWVMAVSVSSHDVTTSFRRTFELGRGVMNIMRLKRGVVEPEGSVSLVDARVQKAASGLGVTVTFIAEGRAQDISMVATSPAEQAKWLHGIQREIIRANKQNNPVDEL